MRGNRDLTAIVFLLLAFIVGGILLGGRGTGLGRPPGREGVGDPSVTNTRSSGSKGVYQWVEKLGYQPVVWRQRWEKLPENGPKVLFVIDPRVENSYRTLTGGSGGEKDSDRTKLSAPDAATLKHWLASGDGHTVILLTSRLASGSTGPFAGSGDQKTFGDAADLIVESASPATARVDFAPLQPVSDTQGVLSLHSDSGGRIKRSLPDALALFGDTAGPLVLDVPVGKGHLIAIADGGLLSNSNLPRSENSVFLANLLWHYAPRGGEVLFDEYHHGDTVDTSGASLWEALGHPLQLVLIQLCLAFVALAVLLAGRFGPPVPLSRGAGRTSAEYVTSVANLYRRAEASGTALETLYRQFLRDICGRLSLPPDVNLETLANVAAQRGQVNKEMLRRLLATCEQRLDEGKLTEQELLDLTRQMERIRKEMGIA